MLTENFPYEIRYTKKKQNHCNLNFCAQITVYGTTIK